MHKTTEIFLKMLESHIGIFLNAGSWAMKNAIRDAETLKDDWQSKQQVKHLLRKEVGN